MDTAWMKEQLTRLAGEDSVRTGEPMANHTTFRVGGPADFFVTVDTVEKLCSLLSFLAKEEAPFFILGNGSNILVSDRGFPGVIVRVKGGVFSELYVTEEEEIVAGAEVALRALASFALEAALTGLEFAHGIPGTLGGALTMNAGAYGGEMKDVVMGAEAVVIRSDGETLRQHLDGKDLHLAYRSSIRNEQEMVFVSARLRLKKGNSEEIEAKMRDYAAQRAGKQPLEYPSAGSTFKRPPGHFAGKLIMDAGLSGYSVGGAQVSEKHCGFVINRNVATASDIYRLMCDVRERVRESSGVSLEPEIILLGDFS